MTNENANPRARLVQAIRKASTLEEQRRLVDALDAYDAHLRAEAAADRAWDAAGAVADQTLSPVRVHEHHTAATDWLGEISTTASENFHQAMVAEASLWYGRVSEAVKADPEEFVEQAKGMARKTAGAYGEQAPSAAQTFLDYVAYLHGKTAASGLPQIDQVRDPKDNPNPTPYPPEVFDNFAPEIDPVNQGIEGTTDSDRAPLIQEIMSNNGGQGTPEEPDQHDTDVDYSHGYSEVPPGQPGRISTGARGSHPSMYRTSVANNYLMNMDDFRAQQAEEQRRSGLDFKNRREARQGPSDDTYYDSFGTPRKLRPGNYVDEYGRMHGDMSPEDEEDMRKLREQQDHEAAKTASESDPNNNGDDDSSPMGDTDGDYWQANPGQTLEQAQAAMRHTAPGGGEHAPYRLEGSGDEWYVVNEKGERKNSEPKTKEEARKFQKALYKNVPGARQSAEEDEEKKGERKEGASSLPMQHQIVDPNNVPTPQADQFNTEVMFPWVMEGQGDGTPAEATPPTAPAPTQQPAQRQSESREAAKRRAFVAGLLTRDPRSWSDLERREVTAYLTMTAGIQSTANWGTTTTTGGTNVEAVWLAPQSLTTGGMQVTADMYSAPHQTPGYETPIANSGDTTPHPATGTYEQGLADGQADRAAGTRPTFSDASSHASPYVQGYAKGFGGAGGDSGASGGYGPDVPYSMGGDASQPTNFQQSQQSAQVARAASRKTADGVSQQKRDRAEDKGHTLPGTDKFPIENKSDLEKAKHDIGRTNEPKSKVVRYINERAEELGGEKVGESKESRLTVSATLVSANAETNPDFRKGYGFARNWKAGRKLVAVGSPAFESGLYAGITDNPAAQRDWVKAHRRQAKRHPDLMKRISDHQRATRKYARNHDDALIRGFYVQAATSTDLLTTGPGTSPDPMGHTPINGPGNMPPMTGEGPANAPGGPAPYNGAPPYGTPAAPDPVMGTPMTPSVPPEVNTAQMPGGYTNPSANQGNPRAAAFRQRVQAALAQQGAA